MSEIIKTILFVIGTIFFTTGIYILIREMEQTISWDFIYVITNLLVAFWCFNSISEK